MRSPLSRIDILKHGLVQTQIRHQLLQPCILIAQLLQLPDLAGLQPTVFLLPAVKRLLRYAQFALDVRHGHTHLVLLHRGHNMLNRVALLPHRQTLLSLVSLAGNSHSN